MESIFWKSATEQNVGTHIARVDDIRQAPFGNTLYLTLSGGEKVTLFAPWKLRCSADRFVCDLPSGSVIQLVIEKYPGMDFFYAKDATERFRSHNFSKREYHGISLASIVFGYPNTVLG